MPHKVDGDEVKVNGLRILVLTRFTSRRPRNVVERIEMPDTGRCAEDELSPEERWWRIYHVMMRGAHEDAMFNRPAIQGLFTLLDKETVSTGNPAAFRKRLLDAWKVEQERRAHERKKDTLIGVHSGSSLEGLVQPGGDTERVKCSE
jgi:hypothetical protein